MSDETHESKKLEDIRDASVLESKFREKIYELDLKRKLLEDRRLAITKLDSEKHEQIQRAENAERELSELKIHLEVAIKAAREAEAERSSARELLVRQRAQLEAFSKEREMLQQLNRNQQKFDNITNLRKIDDGRRDESKAFENSRLTNTWKRYLLIKRGDFKENLDMSDLQRELEDCKSKMKSQSYIFEVIQKKDSLIKTTVDTLTSEVAKLENSQRKLKEVCKRVMNVSKIITVLLNQKKTEVSLLKNGNSDLQDKVISLTVKLEKLTEESSKNLKKEQTVCDHILEWETSQKEMQSRIDENSNEISHLQSCLDSALATLSRYQAIDLQSSEKIRELEKELEKYYSSARKESKFTQTEGEDLKETTMKEACPPISSCEIQSSEVDTCEVQP